MRFLDQLVQGNVHGLVRLADAHSVDERLLRGIGGLEEREQTSAVVPLE